MINLNRYSGNYVPVKFNKKNFSGIIEAFNI